MTPKPVIYVHECGPGTFREMRDVLPIGYEPQGKAKFTKSVFLENGSGNQISLEGKPFRDYHNYMDMRAPNKTLIKLEKGPSGYVLAHRRK
jgi:hypothetical protein